jgi:NAD dependent epimerase/dehydratase family enzyme
VLSAGVRRERLIHSVPKFALHLLYGEMAQIVYASQRVFPEIHGAIQDVVRMLAHGGSVLAVR